MSLYTVTIEDRIYKVNISGDHCTVNGEEVKAKMLQLNRNGLQVLRHHFRHLQKCRHPFAKATFPNHLSPPCG